MELTIISEPFPNYRSVTLTNNDWMIVSQCIESFLETYRAKHSQTVATYVTRGQLDKAVEEAVRMNELLEHLDSIQAHIL